MSVVLCDVLASQFTLDWAQLVTDGGDIHALNGIRASTGQGILLNQIIKPLDRIHVKVCVYMCMIDRAMLYTCMLLLIKRTLYAVSELENCRHSVYEYLYLACRSPSLFNQNSLIMNSLCYLTSKNFIWNDISMYTCSVRRKKG